MGPRAAAGSAAASPPFLACPSQPVAAIASARLARTEAVSDFARRRRGWFASPGGNGWRGRRQAYQPMAIVVAELMVSARMPAIVLGEARNVARLAATP